MQIKFSIIHRCSRFIILYIFYFFIFIRLFFNPGAEENYPMMHDELMFPVLFVPVSVRVNGDEQTNVNNYYSQLLQEFRVCLTTLNSRWKKVQFPSDWELNDCDNNFSTEYRNVLKFIFKEILVMRLPFSCVKNFLKGFSIIFFVGCNYWRCLLNHNVWNTIYCITYKHNYK